MLIYESLQIKSLVLPNRLVMAPMCMYSATDGVANEFHLVHYGSRAQGGVGLIIVEATGVEPEGRITPKCLGLWNNKQVEPLKKIVDFVHQNSATKIGIQLNHSGRKGSTMNGKHLATEDGGWQTHAPSRLAFQPDFQTPLELSKEEIHRIVNSFAKAAKRAVDANFDTIEIHAAHGYLLHQFLSPLSNQRTDEYGGSFDNRIRMLLEVVEAVQAVIPIDMPLFVRISATEYAEYDGWDLESSNKLASILKDKGVDAIDVSTGGGIYNAKITPYTAYQLPYAESIKMESGLTTGTVGLVDSIEKAEDIMKNSNVDLIFMGRVLLREPYLPVRGSFEYDAACYFPTPYERGKPLKS